MAYSQDTLRAEMEQIREGMSQMPGKMDTEATKLDSVISALTSIDGRVDGLEALITATNTKLDALNTALVPPNTSLYNTAIGALGNPTLKSGSGKVYAFAATGIIEIRDNATVLWTTVGNTSIRFQSPLVYSTSLKLFSTLGSGVSLQYD